MLCWVSSCWVSWCHWLMLSLHYKNFYFSNLQFKLSVKLSYSDKNTNTCAFVTASKNHPGLILSICAILEISPIIWRWQNICRYCLEAIRYNSKQENFIRHRTKLRNAKSTLQSNETQQKQGIWLKKYRGIS